MGNLFISVHAGRVCADVPMSQFENLPGLLLWQTGLKMSLMSLKFHISTSSM